MCLKRIFKTKDSKQIPVLSAFRQVVRATDSHSESFRNGTEEQEHHFEEAAVTQQQMVNLPTVCLGREQQESIHRKPQRDRPNRRPHWHTLRGFICQFLFCRGRDVYLLVSLIMVEHFKLICTCPVSVIVEGTLQQENEVKPAESYP